MQVEQLGDARHDDLDADAEGEEGDHFVDDDAAAVADFKAVYEDLKESYQKEGKPFEEVEFAFSYDLPSFLVYYADLISYKGLSKLTGIAPAQLSQYISGYRNPSPKTTQKIQAALHSFGNELCQLQLL